MSLRFVAPVLGMLLASCAHGPETVVHLSAPASAHWTVRDAKGSPLCTLPCTVELDANDSIAVTRDGGTPFIVQQEHIGAGSWIGDIRVREEPTPGALAVQRFSDALAGVGTTLVETRRKDRVGPGIVLAVLGTAGVLASTALPTKKREELWLQRTSPTVR